jgi:hypothetical protein
MSRFTWPSPVAHVSRLWPSSASRGAWKNPSPFGYHARRGGTRGRLRLRACLSALRGAVWACCKHLSRLRGVGGTAKTVEPRAWEDSKPRNSNIRQLGQHTPGTPRNADRCLQTAKTTPRKRDSRPEQPLVTQIARQNRQGSLPAGTRDPHEPREREQPLSPKSQTPTRQNGKSPLRTKHQGMGCRNQG